MPDNSELDPTQPVSETEKSVSRPSTGFLHQLLSSVARVFSETSQPVDSSTDPYSTPDGYFSHTYGITPGQSLRKSEPPSQSSPRQTRRSALDEPNEIHY